MPKKNQNREEIIENALAGGLIGAALGAALTGRGDRSIIAALVGAAIGASITAQKEAEEMEVPVVYENDGVIYKVYPDGHKEVIKRIKKNQIPVPREFRLE